MTPEQLGEMDSGTGLDRLLAARGAGAHSVMALPLIARGAIMGMVVLYRLAGSRPFTSADLALAGDLVARAAVSVDNARHYTRERATALELRRGPRPGPPPAGARPGRGPPPRARARPGRAPVFRDLPPGLPLGIGVAGGGHSQAPRLHVPRHSTLVLYTDGLIESPAADMSTAMARLARTFTNVSQLPVTEACDTLLAAR